MAARIGPRGHLLLLGHGSFSFQLNTSVRTIVSTLSFSRDWSAAALGQSNRYARKHRDVVATAANTGALGRWDVRQAPDAPQQFADVPTIAFGKVCVRHI